jgi:DNA helicase-2/ATP-dependent DNA helicase PcrA
MVDYSVGDDEIDIYGFCMGQRVRHPKFGQGTVVDHEGKNDRARVHVRFDVYGSKWLALAYANLEAV